MQNRPLKHPEQGRAEWQAASCCSEVAVSAGNHPCSCTGVQKLTPQLRCDETCFPLTTHSISVVYSQYFNTGWQHLEIFHLSKAFLMFWALTLMYEMAKLLRTRCKQQCSQSSRSTGKHCPALLLPNCPQLCCDSCIPLPNSAEHSLAHAVSCCAAQRVLPPLLLQ